MPNFVSVNTKSASFGISSRKRGIDACQTKLQNGLGLLHDAATSAVLPRKTRKIRNYGE
jgi:hypothetical protein